MRRRSQSGFLLSDTRYAPGFSGPQHCHGKPVVCFLVRGSYSQSTRGERAAHLPGSTVFLPAGEPHDGVMGERGARCLHLEIGGRWMSVAQADGGLPATPISAPAGPLPWLALRLHREFRAPHSGSRLLTEGIALEMLGHLVRERSKAASRPPRWVVRVRDRLHDELAKTLTITEMAGELGISPTRLSTVFRRHFGEGVGEMHRRLKVEAACRSLRSTSRPVAEIALDLGFFDQSHFTRTFRALTGTTPASYRRSLS